MRRGGFLAVLISLAVAGPAAGGKLRAGVAAVDLVADDGMVIGGGIGPRKAVGQEVKLRASADVIEDPPGTRVALIECDVLMVDCDVLDDAARRIERALNTPFDHVLINAIDTHSAPTTVSIHGYRREEGFVWQVGGGPAVTGGGASSSRVTSDIPPV